MRGFDGMTINTGSTRVNYGNLFLISLLLCGGILISFNDANANKQGVSDTLNAVNTIVPAPQQDSVWNSEYNTVSNSISLTSTVQITGVIVLIVCIAFSMYFMRGMA